MILRNFKSLQTTLCASIHYNSPIVFENTLVHWVLQFFRNDLKYQTHQLHKTTNQSVNKIWPLLKSTNTLSSMNLDKLLSHMIIVSEHLIKDKRVINNVDQELCRRLNSEEYNDCEHILSITDTLLYFTHNRIYMVKSYRMCIELIEKVLRYKNISLQHFIQCTFYTSILKDDPLARDIMELILGKIHVDTVILHKISPLELAILCNSIYKTSTKIKSKKVIKTIFNVLDTDANVLFEFPELGVSILKPLHQAKCSDYDVLQRLSENIMNKNVDINNYGFTSVVNFLKLFTNALYNDEQLIKYLATIAVKKLRTMYLNKEYIRAKDISTLLKSFCEMGSDFLKPIVVDDVMPLLYNAVTNNKLLKKERRSLTEILLWISILDSSIFQKEFLNQVICYNLITAGKNDVKGVARMNLLLTILSIEQLLPVNEKNGLSQLIEHTEGYDLKRIPSKRPILYQIYKAVNGLSQNNESSVLKVNLECQIPNLYLPAITVQTDSLDKVVIESLDEKVCLHNTSIPNGYVKLKLRLLKKLKYKVITIPQDIVEKGSECLIPAIEDNITRLEQEE